MTNAVMAVDLAARYSALCVVDAGGTVVYEANSKDQTSVQLINNIIFTIEIHSPSIVLIEDVPYGISSQAMVKPVLRLQGMLIHALISGKYEDKALFVNPSTWQKTYPGVARGKKEEREAAARQHALDLGYTPPSLVQNHIDSLPEGAKVLKKNTNPLAKIETDHIDAYLMAHWGQKYADELAGMSGVQPIFI